MSRAVWCLVWLCALPGAAAERYRLDAGNTRVSFGVRLLGVAVPWLGAQFAELSGEYVAGRPSAASRVDVTVQVSSLACDNSWWRARLLSAEWFDAKQYPQITYHSDRVRPDGAGGATIDGQLSLHGHTRSVTLIVDRWVCAGGAADDECSFDARARLKRSDYGLPHGFWLGGDEVDIVIRGTGVRAL